MDLENGMDSRDRQRFNAHIPLVPLIELGSDQERGAEGEGRGKRKGF